MDSHLTLYSGNANITIVYRDYETRFIVKRGRSVAISKITPMEVRSLYSDGIISNYNNNPMSYAHVVTKTILDYVNHELVLYYNNQEHSFKLVDSDWVRFLGFIDKIVNRHVSIPS